MLLGVAGGLVYGKRGINTLAETDADTALLVTDDDNEAREAILHAAEMYLWDSNDGEERVLKVIHNN